MTKKKEKALFWGHTQNTEMKMTVKWDEKGDRYNYYHDADKQSIETNDAAESVFLVAIVT